MLSEVSSIIFQLYYQQAILWYSMIAVLGAIVGSFITMLCHRLPIMLEWTEPTAQSSNINLLFPRSFCPNCQHSLSWWQNIPFFGYLLVRGKCHFCQHKISPNYFLIEISSIFLSVITAIAVDNPIHTLWWLMFTWLAIALFILDCKYLLLPDSLNYMLLWSGLIFSVINKNTETAIISACIGYASFAIINVIYKIIRKRDGIGQGDFKLLAGIAVWFGWYELPNIVLIASLLGLSYALWLFVTKNNRENGENKTINLNLTLPFAPFLLTSAWLLMVYLQGLNN